MALPFGIGVPLYLFWPMLKLNYYDIALYRTPEKSLVHHFLSTSREILVQKTPILNDEKGVIKFYNEKLENGQFEKDLDTSIVSKIIENMWQTIGTKKYLFCLSYEANRHILDQSFNKENMSNLSLLPNGNTMVRKIAYDGHFDDNLKFSGRLHITFINQDKWQGQVDSGNLADGVYTFNSLETYDGSGKSTWKKS